MATSPRPQPSLTALYVRWRYRRARAHLTAVYAEWSKLDYPGYQTNRLLLAEKSVLYWRNRLHEPRY